MKKILFMFLLLIPFIAKAEVKIIDVELANHTEGLEVDEHPTFEGLKLNFDVKFVNVNDFVTYKITIKNDTNKDYEIETGESYTDDEFVKYEVDYDEESAVLKAGAEKVIYISAFYNKEVPIESYVDGGYRVKKAVDITLSNDQKENPKTSVGIAILVIAIIMFISVVVMLINKYKLDHLYGLLAIALLSIPFVVIALEKISIQIEADVEIEPAFQEIHYMMCRFGEYESLSNNISDKKIIDKTLVVRKTMSPWTVSRNDEFYRLNPDIREGDFRWGSDSGVYPTEFLECINEVEYFERTAEHMSDEDEAKYAAYWDNFYACREAHHDYSEFPLPENYDGDLGDLPFQNKDIAVYYYDGCFYIT